MTSTRPAPRRAHQSNIDRYERLLQTYLTETERKYVERRLSEEHAAAVGTRSPSTEN